MKLKFSACLLAVGALFSLPAYATTIVENGSFEDFDATKLNGSGWHVYPSIPSWTAVSGAGIEIQTNPTLGTIDAQDGRAYVELDSDNNSSMTQFVNLNVGSYLLKFFYSPRNGDSGDNGIDYSIAGLTGNISGPSVDPLTGVGFWTEISALFKVTTAGSYALNFAATGTSNSYGGFVDNVSVAPVPVPAAGFLLFGALGGLAALRRRRKAA
jgi:hypothetical protein